MAYGDSIMVILSCSANLIISAVALFPLAKIMHCISCISTSGGTEPYTFRYQINGGLIQTKTTTTGSSVDVSVPTTSTGTYVRITSYNVCYTKLLRCAGSGFIDYR